MHFQIAELAANGTSIYLNQVVWSAPDPPQGIILHYNMRISSASSGEVIVPLVEGIENTFFDVRPYALSDGDYFIEVGVAYCVIDRVCSVMPLRLNHEIGHTETIRLSLRFCIIIIYHTRNG